MPSNDFVERALSHIKDMHQATGELAEEPGLPPEAKHDLQSIMDDNAAPIQNSPASVEGSASEKGNDLTTRMPAYAGVDMQFSHYNPLIRQLGGRYTLIRPLGRGGMANVYLVWDEQTQREVAAKVMIPDVNDPERSQRFLREGQIAVSLHHQHIVHVYDYGDRVQVKMPNDPDALSSNELILPNVVMEYVGGGDLKDRLITGKAYPLDETVRIFKQLSAAVQYIHDRGMVHRDIKPANILFRKPSQEDGQAEVVLSDFGLAIDDNVTLSNPYAGTLAYMAPEQWGGNPQKASDIYSLGVVLYQLCVGAPPSPWVLSRKSGQLNSSLPSSELDNVILRALSSDPSQRFASVSLFCQALEEAAKQVKLPVRVPGIVTQAVLSPPDRATGKEEIAETVDSTRIDDAGEAHPSLHDLSSVGLSSPVIDVTMQPSRKGEVRKRRQVGIVAFAVILCLVFSFGGIAFFASQGTTTPGIGIINKPHNEPIGVSDGTYTFDVGT